MKKTAIITGASIGIGRATAIELGKKGYWVFLLGRNESRLAETKTLIEQEHGVAEVVSVDLSDTLSVMSAVKSIKSKADTINLICNIAAIWHGDDDVYAGVDYEDFREELIISSIHVGVLSPMILVHGLLPSMNKGSVIMNLSGTFTGDGAAGWLPYYVSKRALEDFTVGLAEELGDKGILVFGVSPGGVSTEAFKKFFPEDAENALNPQEVAEFIVKKASNCKKEDSGKIFVIKKGEEVFEDFHF